MRLATLGGLKLPNHSVRLMADILREAGFDVDLALAISGIPAALIEDPTGEVGGFQELAFQRAFCSLTADAPHLWLKLGSRYHLLSHAHSYYALLLATAENVQVAVETGLRFADLVYTLLDATPLYDGGRLTGVRALTTEVPAELRRFTVLRDLVTTYRVFCELWGAPFPFDRIDLPLPRADADLVASIHADIPITYEAECACWVWSVDLRGKTLTQSDEVLSSAYAEKCARLVAAARTVQDPVRRMLDLLDASRGRLGLEEAAERIGQSPRTLQRHLRRKGLSFRDLAAVSRHRAACRFLIDTQMPISQIALEVGYENPSSFDYAFRRHSGMSPRSYRQRGSPVGANAAGKGFSLP